MNGRPVEEPIEDASTVIVLRDTSAGIETFMLCRHRQSGFMGGAHVFPGGKVDAEDSAPRWASRINRSPEELATILGEETDPMLGMGLLIAGVRETFEEAGVLLARANADANLDQVRVRLHEGAGFLSLAEEIDARIDAMALAPYARWVTPKMESRRFDTRFYIAVLPEGQRASHDGSETTSAAWLRPAEAIDAMISGRIKLAPPTVRTLRWLSDFDEAESAIEDALCRKPPLVRPRIVAGDRGWFLALPGDREHPEDQPVLPGATRMVLQGSAWVDAT
jgi:8-oxo-dGTP pyrophosphatase MutT (NUDIX family)